METCWPVLVLISFGEIWFGEKIRGNPILKAVAGGYWGQNRAACQLLSRFGATDSPVVHHGPPWSTMVRPRSKLNLLCSFQRHRSTAGGPRDHSCPRFPSCSAASPRVTHIWTQTLNFFPLKWQNMWFWCLRIQIAVDWYFLRDTITFPLLVGQKN